MYKRSLTEKSQTVKVKRVQLQTVEVKKKISYCEGGSRKKKSDRKRRSSVFGQ